MSKERFNKAFLRAVDFGFESLGKSCKKALYFHLENSFNVRQKDVLERVECFDEALKHIFKDGATYVERLVLEKLCEELGVKFEESYVSDFAKAVSEIKGMVSEEEPVLIMASNFDEERALAKKRRGGERVGLGTNILVVDDDAAIRMTLSKILEKEGYLVETAESGRKAIRMSNERFFNVALIDIRLPDIEGTMLLEKLKITEPRMVKIIITGYPSLKNAVETVNRGADGYVMKPFDAGELLAMIEEHLKRQRETMKYSDEKVAEYIETRVREVEPRHKRRAH